MATAKYRQIQDQLKILQDQKNKSLEDLSVVCGKMQGQKTASGDPKTLQVEVHQKDRRPRRPRKRWRPPKTPTGISRPAAGSKTISSPKLPKSLNRLYTHSKNPAQIDWSLFDLELQSLDETFGKFCESLNIAADVASVRAQIEPLKESFGKFKHAVKNIAKDPQASLAAFQKELQQVLAQKEALAEVVRKLDAEHSGAKIGAEFLGKQLIQLQQERLHLELELKKAQSHSFDDFVKELIVEEDRVRKDLDAQSQKHRGRGRAVKASF